MNATAKAIVKHSGTPLLLAYPAYLLGCAVGTLIGTIWNASQGLAPPYLRRMPAELETRARLLTDVRRREVA